VNEHFETPQGRGLVRPGVGLALETGLFSSTSGLALSDPSSGISAAELVGAVPDVPARRWRHDLAVRANSSARQSGIRFGRRRFEEMPTIKEAASKFL
jgi:hypothetical protein